MSQEQYIEMTGNLCPVCHSDNTEYHNPTDIEVNMKCVDCKSTWIEKIKITGYKDLKLSSKVLEENALERAIDAFWTSLSNSYPDLKRHVYPLVISNFNKHCSEVLYSWLKDQGKKDD